MLQKMLSIKLNFKAIKKRESWIQRDSIVAKTIRLMENNTAQHHKTTHRLPNYKCCLMKEGPNNSAPIVNNHTLQAS